MANKAIIRHRHLGGCQLADYLRPTYMGPRSAHRKKDAPGSGCRGRKAAGYYLPDRSPPIPAVTLRSWSLTGVNTSIVLFYRDKRVKIYLGFLKKSLLANQGCLDSSPPRFRCGPESREVLPRSPIFELNSACGITTVSVRYELLSRKHAFPRRGHVTTFG
jgi:hypothetical protein